VLRFRELDGRGSAASARADAGARSRARNAARAQAGIAHAVTSFAFLFLSEHQPLFGFMDYGYRPAIIAALAAEATTAALLIAYLGTLLRRR
jgi:hypothetical protein